jgi:DNA repair exonuclease SbcCD nuclease subunit
MRITYFTDPHITETPPRRRKDSYYSEVLAKLEKVCEYSRKTDMTICGGDIFHSKNTKHISFGMVNRLLDIFREMPDLVIVVGNHDLDGSLNFVGRPIETLGKLPNVTVVGKRLLEYDEFRLACIGGGELFPESEILETLTEWNKPDKYNVAVLHAPVCAVPLELPFPTIALKTLAKQARLFLLGHLHNYQFCNNRLVAPGSLTRGTLLMDDVLGRSVNIGDIELNKEGVTKAKLIEIPVLPVDEVFKMEEKQVELDGEKEVMSFAQEIEQIGIPKGLDKEELLSQIRSLDGIDSRVRDKAIQILERS